MFAFTNSTEKNTPTVIGAGCVVVGDINTDHIIQIHGIVKGNVKALTVIIGRGGKIIGSVKAGEIFMHGAMDGPVAVDTAHIYSDATMSGQLSYIKLNIHNNDGLECKLNRRKG